MSNTRLKAFIRPIFVLSLAIWLGACGGGSSSGTSAPGSQPQTILGADGASATFLTQDLARSSDATVRVARDGSGAPPLPEGTSAAGAVYQFTPLGLSNGAIELAVPFDASTVPQGSQPRLLVAQAGGYWSEVAGAQVQGGAMKGSVPELSYATVGYASAPAASALEAKEASVQKSAASGPSLSLRADASTQPSLPAADRFGIVRLAQTTALGLQVNYQLPARCSSSESRLRVAAVYIARKNGINSPAQRVDLLNQPLTALSGSVLVKQNLGSDNNGVWIYAAEAYCVDRVQLRNGQTVSVIRAALLTVGPTLIINIQAVVGLPAIAQAPQNANVVEGNAASFSVSATGSSLAYQWQRSNNGGTSYTDISGANAASLSLTAALTDDGSFWRVIVKNSAGSVTSTSARLTVAPRVVASAPAITRDPANQAVQEGETASFGAAASGVPTPSVQWQTRSTTQANPSAGWVNIAGATASSYTTSPLTLAASSSQYRAVFQNSAGSASSLPATLSVAQRLIAPSISSAPASQTVQVGQFGLFSVGAAGSSPLSFQWFKNGQAIVGANATEVLVQALAADVGSSYQITVQVSNAAGTLTSAAASMAIISTPTTNTGTLVSAAKGGVVTSGTGQDDGPSLVVPAGALPSDTTITLVASSAAAIGLPAGAVALGDVLDIGPAGLNFVTPATLRLPLPTQVPEGKVLAVLEYLDSATGKLVKAGNNNNNSKATPLSLALQTTNLGRLATNQKNGAGTIMMAAAAGGAPNVLCADAQSTRGGSFIVDTNRAARYITAAVSPEQCTSNSTTKITRALIPSSTTAPCTDADWLNATITPIQLVSRHVQCGLYVVNDFDITGADGTDYGKFRWEVRVGSYGPANGLNKTFSFATRLSRTAPAFADSPKKSTALPSLGFQPVITCNAVQASGGTCQLAPAVMNVTANASVPADIKQGWTSGNNAVLNLGWSGGDGTWTDFSFNQLEMYFAKPGETINLAGQNYSGFNLGFSALRCDKKLTVNKNDDGCIYQAAPAVFVMSVNDSTVKEAAEHIREAQTGSLSAPGGLEVDSVTGVATARVSNALQRTRIAAANNSNRKASCGTDQQSLLNTRPAPISASCQANPAGCQCDEYPFASTWNGGFFGPNSTSVKRIQGPQNGRAGNLHQIFFLKERILDFTTYTGSDTQPYDAGLQQNRTGDDFWVHIE